MSNIYKFSDIAELKSEKINVNTLSVEQYITTDNMLPNLGGVGKVEKLPNTKRCNSFKKGDILFSNIRTYFRKVWLAEFDGGCSADVLIIKSKNERILLNDYLYLIICSNDFIAYTVASSNGSKMPRGSKAAIFQYEFSLPDIEEQRKIVKFFFALKDKISINNKTNQTLEQIAQAIFKSWFIDFDPVKAKIEGGIEQAMAVISGKNATELHRLQTENPTAYRELHQLANAFPDEMVEVEGFGQVPRGWEVKSIADKQILEIIKPKIYPFDGEKEYIATANVSKNSIVGELEIITYDERPTRANMQPIVDSIWFAKMVGEHKAILIDKDDKQLLDNTILSTGFLGLKPNKNKKCFVYCYINSPYFEQAKNQLATGAVQIALNNTSFGKIEIVLPNEEVLSYFEEKISSIFSMISQNQRENQNLAKIRDLLLPKLLSGEV